MHLSVMQDSTCIYAAANATGASNFIHYFNQYENAISSIKHLIRFYPSTRIKLSPSLFNSNLITIAEKGLSFRIFRLNLNTAQVTLHRVNITIALFILIVGTVISLASLLHEKGCNVPFLL